MSNECHYTTKIFFLSSFFTLQFQSIENHIMNDSLPETKTVRFEPKPSLIIQSIPKVFCCQYDIILQLTHSAIREEGTKVMHSPLNIQKHSNVIKSIYMQTRRMKKRFFDIFIIDIEILSKKHCHHDVAFAIGLLFSKSKEFLQP